MTDFLWAMGPYLLPLLVLSVYGVGLILHKFQILRTSRPVGPGTFSGILDRIALGQDPTDLVDPAHPLGQLLTHAGEGAYLLQARAQAQLARLEDRISYFPALANVATLSGLFGTVCGMIGAFLSLRAGGGADPSSLAGGLGQALVATALGLVTAIPSMAAHAVFQKQVQATGAQMEALLSALLGGTPGKAHG